MKLLLLGSANKFLDQIISLVTSVFKCIINNDRIELIGNCHFVGCFIDPLLQRLDALRITFSKTSLQFLDGGWANKNGQRLITEYLL